MTNLITPSGLIFFRGMTGVVALEVTPAAEAAEVFKFQPSGHAIGSNDHPVKIDQIGVVGGGPLTGTDAMRIVAG